MSQPDIVNVQDGAIDRVMIQSDSEVISGWKFKDASKRWITIFESGAQAIAAAGATDYTSRVIEIWMFDQVIVEFRVQGPTTDADVLVTPVDSSGNTVSYFFLPAALNNGVDDIKAIFAQTAMNAGAANVYGVFVLTQRLGLHSITISGENDDGVNAGTFSCEVYGRRL